jgi:hypothetical protein
VLASPQSGHAERSDPRIDVDVGGADSIGGEIARLLGSIPEAHVLLGMGFSTGPRALFIPRSPSRPPKKGGEFEMRTIRMKKRDQGFLMAAVAGITMGLSAPAPSVADEKADDVKCWGINGCGSHAKCSVSADDLKALQTLLGEKEYAAKFGKSEAHSCGGHAKCGSESQILNWVPTSRGECKAQGGYLVEEVAKKKVAKKA